MNFLLKLSVSYLLLFVLIYCQQKDKMLKKEKTLSAENSVNNKTLDSAVSPNHKAENFYEPPKNMNVGKPAIPEIVEPISPVPFIYPVIACFDPNLRLEDAMELLHSNAVDTQWFIVERRELKNHSDFFTKQDTIYLKD